MKKILLLIIVSCFLEGCIYVGPTNFKDNFKVVENYIPTQDNTWTFMVYMAADDNLLDNYAKPDLDEMRKGLKYSKNENINIIVLCDLLGPDNTDLYKINIDGSKEHLDDGRSGTGHTSKIIEYNMGDPDVLKWFINHCKRYFEAENYALILWNHGDGARSSSLPDYTKNICSDTNSSYDALYLNEVQDAITESKIEKFDFIGFDACLMGTVEVVYEFRNLADYIAASMASEWAYGWDYEILLSSMKNPESKTYNAEDLSKLVVHAYRESVKDYLDNHTLSAIDMSQVDNLKSKIDEFAEKIYNESEQANIEADIADSYRYASTSTSSYIDLSKFTENVIKNDTGTYSSGLINAARDVISAMQEAVVLAYAGKSYGGYFSDSNGYGLSIFYYETQAPWYTTAVSGNSGQIDFCTTGDAGIDTWKDLLDDWY